MHRMLHVVLAFVLAVGGLAVAAAPAQAALPNCVKTVGLVGGSGLRSSTAASSTNDWRCVMYQGAENSGVGAMQRALQKCYGLDIAVDGVFGPRTRSALISAQRTMGADPDGVWGPETSDKILNPYYNADDIFVRCR